MTSSWLSYDFDLEKVEDMEDPFLMRRESAAELFLIRHADAIPEADEIIPSGVYNDLPLSRVGRDQALALAERFKGMSFNAAYSSPLRRCQETAAPLIEHLHLSLILVPGLQEVRLGQPLPVLKDVGNLEELTRALQARQVEIVRLAGGSGHWDAIPNSEPSREFRQRVVDAIDAIAHSHQGERVLIFCHGGVVNAYLAEVLELEKDFFFPAANTSITVVRVNSSRRVLYVMNDLAHLSRQA